jgi:hypothetical protein
MQSDSEDPTPSPDQVGDDGADDFLAALDAQEKEEDDEDAPRMNWPAEAPTSPSSSDGEKDGDSSRQSESIMRRMARRFTVGGGTKKKDGEADPNRGSSISRFFGGGAKKSTDGDGDGSEGGDGAQRRGSSLARFLGADDDGRGASLSRLVMSEDKDGKLKAFRNVRKLASLTRKGVTGKSSSEAAQEKARKAAELEASRRFQQVRSSESVDAS